MTTCLIGEADPFLARLLQRYGEASGLQIVRAEDGQEMLDLARELRPDVIIIDAELPGTLRGWEAVHAFRAEPALAGIPVITCSWLPQSEARDLAGEVAGHLLKPDLHYDDFLAALQGAGVRSRPRRAARGPKTTEGAA